MKYRLDYVTNSSSSSFVCDVCGSVEAGYDLGMSDCGMSECVKGHTFCDYHVDGEIEDRYEVSEEQCPICSMSCITDKEMMQFLLKMVNMTEKEVTEKIRVSFATYDEFKTYIK
jgi:hypothetical protein